MVCLSKGLLLFAISHQRFGEKCPKKSWEGRLQSTSPRGCDRLRGTGSIYLISCLFIQVKDDWYRLAGEFHAHSR